MKFEWDEEKNLSNQKKHHISFETAVFVFSDENHIELYDYENSTLEEDRYIAIGLVGDVLYVVFTEKKDATRIISARKATPQERRDYYDEASIY